MVGALTWIMYHRQLFRWEAKAMKYARLYISLVGSILCLQALSSEPERFSFPLGWYSFPEICQRLSTSTRKVECAPDLRECLALLCLKERTWQSLQSLLRNGLEVELKQIDEHRWRLERCNQATACSKELLDALCKYVHNEFERTMARFEPSMKEFDYRFVTELVQIIKSYKEFGEEWWEQNKDRFDSPSDPAVLSELLNAYEMNVNPELERWATAWLQTFPESVQVGSAFDDPHTLRKLAVLTAANAATRWKGSFLFHALWSDARLRPSVEEAITKGYSVRVQPLRRYVNDPQVVNWLLFEELSPSTDRTFRIDDIVIVYGFNWYGLENGNRGLYFGLEPFVYLCEPGRCSELYTLQTVVLSRGRDASWTKFLFEQLGDTGKRVWQETEEEYERLRKSPLANTPYVLPPAAYPSGISRRFARWVYEWASASGAEVVMEVFPQRDDCTLDVDMDSTDLKLKLTLGYLLSLTGDKCGWYARLLDGVVMVQNRLRFLDRLSQMPLASLKHLVMQSSSLSSRTLVEAVRKMGNSTRFFSLCRPTWVLTLDPNVSIAETLYPGNLWRLYQVDSLLGFIPKASRNRLYTEGGRVHLADFPPPALGQTIASLKRNLSKVDRYTAWLFHPQAEDWVRGQWIEFITYERVVDGRRWLFTSCDYSKQDLFSIFGSPRIGFPEDQWKR
jgi:hypothetical protein